MYSKFEKKFQVLLLLLRWRHLNMRARATHSKRIQNFTKTRLFWDSLFWDPTHFSEFWAKLSFCDLLILVGIYTNTQVFGKFLISSSSKCIYSICIEVKIWLLQVALVKIFSVNPASIGVRKWIAEWIPTAWLPTRVNVHAEWMPKWSDCRLTKWSYSDQ